VAGEGAEAGCGGHGRRRKGRQRMAGWGQGAATTGTAAEPPSARPLPCAALEAAPHDEAACEMPCPSPAGTDRSG
jgi:hypothetical protein